jgi:hypothetical protein
MLLHVGNVLPSLTNDFLVFRFIDPARRKKGTDLPMLPSATDEEGKLKILTVVPGDEPISYDMFESLDM